MSSGGQQNDGSATESLLFRSNGGCGWDILKSIVYGGLSECIRSSAVTSFISCSRASTSSDLGLGVAMMVFDFIFFAKNLVNLKNGTNISPVEEEEVDRYEELLGSRQKFGLHSAISIISFCVFGLIPLLVYFFSFSETDDKNLKLVSVLTASLLCITLLTAAEIYARNRPESYLETVVHYAKLAIKSSALYHFFRKFLKHEDNRRILLRSPNQQVEGVGAEILRSIVFGGLPQCITSLGVVSCAAGSGASTWNIVALGFANLLTGLTVIAYSLQELSKEDQQDRNNSHLCAVVSVLSLLAFGLVPPLFCVVFEDTNYKILSTFAASLFCILLLAVGKVWVQNPPKSYLKSVLHYGSIAVCLSVISFSIGYLISEALKMIVRFQPNQADKLLSAL